MCDGQKDIKVSVGCLAYNHEKYIRKTLDGFVHQITDFDFEVWIHDDASTDHTPDIIQEYAEKYPAIIKPIYQQENQYSKGISITKTHIFPKMHGKYIAYCEGDDYWNDPYKLQKQFDALETHPECSISVHRVQYCNEDGTPNPGQSPKKCYHIYGNRVITKKELADYYFTRCAYLFQASSYFYRREIAEIDLEYSLDIGMLRKCLIIGDLYYIDEPMSTYRLGSMNGWTSTMRSGGVQTRWKHLLWCNEAEDRFDKYTEYKYHDLIKIGKLNKFLAFTPYSKYRYKVKKMLKKYDAYPWKVRKKLSTYRFLKLQMKYTLGMYFPGLYSFIIKMRNGLIR